MSERDNSSGNIDHTPIGVRIKVQVSVMQLSRSTRTRCFTTQKIEIGRRVGSSSGRWFVAPNELHNEKSTLRTSKVLSAYIELDVHFYRLTIMIQNKV